MGLAHYPVGTPTVRAAGVTRLPKSVFGGFATGVIGPGSKADAELD